MFKRGPSGGSGSPQLMVFTDLDGTLLDHDTYGWEAAAPALEQLRANRVPVVLISSKTRAEMAPLREALQLEDPFVSENGGGIFLPRAIFREEPEGAASERREADDFWEIPLGVPYEHLVSALREIRDQLGIAIRGFSDMGLEEITRCTGLRTDEARLARLRDYDEPFILAGHAAFDPTVLSKAAAEKGLKVTRGGRFFHLLGHNGKGEAMSRILAIYHARYGHIRSIALGDSENDFSMLKRADVPVLVRSKKDATSLKTDIPKLTITEAMGPAGWNSAVLKILHPIEEVTD